MFFTPDHILETLINEDLPYGDLTTDMLQINGLSGTISFTSRSPGVVSCTEEVCRILTKLHAEVDFSLESGNYVENGQTIIKARGSAASLHAAWKICANILEYYSAVASRTRMMVDILKACSSSSVIGSTRKNIPGTKALAIKAVLNGGGTVHRICLSDSVLIFKQHRVFFQDDTSFEKALYSAKKAIPEKKILIEIEHLDELEQILPLAIDGIQIDKCTPEEIRSAVNLAKTVKPDIIILAAGGINNTNIEKYAHCGADVIVTSSMYHGATFDIGVTVSPLNQT